MELIVFDLDGTLLDRDSAISPYTRETLRLLAGRDIAYTVATGRTLHAATAILDGHGFRLPQVFKNGVMIWDPNSRAFSHRNVLTLDESRKVIEACLAEGISPFVFTLGDDHDHAVYHAPVLTPIEERMVEEYGHRRALRVGALATLTAADQISHVSAIGDPDAIDRVLAVVSAEAHLVAYSGVALAEAEYRWLDIHHSNASKGGAIEILKASLGAERVICFGDSENDLSMFAMADESYAPANARKSVKSVATAVIGHHGEEGIATFLRERFGL